MRNQHRTGGGGGAPAATGISAADLFNDTWTGSTDLEDVLTQSGSPVAGTAGWTAAWRFFLDGSGDPNPTRLWMQAAVELGVAGHTPLASGQIVLDQESLLNLILDGSLYHWKSRFPVLWSGTMAAGDVAGYMNMPVNSSSVDVLDMLGNQRVEVLANGDAINFVVFAPVEQTD